MLPAAEKVRSEGVLDAEALVACSAVLHSYQSGQQIEWVFPALGTKFDTEVC